MHWDHRVLKHKLDEKHLPDDEYPDGYWRGIHEVYYDEDGKPSMYTSDAISVTGNNKNGLKWTLDKMLECLEKDELDAELDFPYSEDEDVLELTEEDIVELEKEEENWDEFENNGC